MTKLEISSGLTSVFRHFLKIIAKIWNLLNNQIICSMVLTITIFLYVHICSTISTTGIQTVFIRPIINNKILFVKRTFFSVDPCIYLCNNSRSPVDSAGILKEQKKAGISVISSVELKEKIGETLNKL